MVHDHLRLLQNRRPDAEKMSIEDMEASVNATYAMQYGLSPECVRADRCVLPLQHGATRLHMWCKTYHDAPRSRNLDDAVDPSSLTIDGCNPEDEAVDTEDGVDTSDSVSNCGDRKHAKLSTDHAWMRSVDAGLPVSFAQITVMPPPPPVATPHRSNACPTPPEISESGFCSSFGFFEAVFCEFDPHSLSRTLFWI